MESVTGSKLGTNQLLRTAVSKSTSVPMPAGATVVDEAHAKVARDKEVETDSAYQVKQTKGREKGEVVDNVVLPESLSGGAPSEAELKAEVEGQDLSYEAYSKYMQTWREGMAKGLGQKKMKEMGYESMTYDRWMQEQKAKKAAEDPVKAAEEERLAKERKDKRIAALRVGKDIQAFNSQGQSANVDGFKLGAEPSILNVETDGLSQRMLLFSPQWFQVQGASGLTDDQLALELDGQDAEARTRVREQAKKAREEKLRIEQEKEREKRRQQQILDYSAQVSGGFIEVKIGEDVEAMRDAWNLHMKKRRELFAKGVGQKEIDAMGLKNYNWEDWKRYYRRMHGMPEDGIKRIPFEGKKKERKVDWSPRAALSAEELAEAGIEVSEDGPVMIPLSSAMEISNKLLAGAKTVYSVRDGLEVMRQGLESEAQKMKAMREGGIPVVEAVNNQQDEPSVEVVQPGPAQFEDKF